MKYSIIIPCYKSSLTIGKVVGLLEEQFDPRESEIILVNDGSPDGGATFEALRELAEQYSNVTAIDLAKNVGQHNAVMCALNQTRGDYILAMDDDMQTHPSQIPLLLAELEKGYDVVYAYYPDKKHSGFRNFGSWVNNMSVRLLIGKPKWMHTSSFWVIRRFVRDAVVEYKNPNAYIQGLFLRTTRNIACVPVQHFAREQGKSGYTFKKLVKLWSNIIGFSIVPLRISTFLGFGFSGVAVLLALFYLLRKLIFGVSLTGWTSIIVAILFFSGLNLLFMGLIGEYVGRLFLASNREPQYIIREKVGQEEKDTLTV